METNSHKTQREIENIRKYTESIFRNLDSEEDRNLISNELEDIDSNKLVFRDRDRDPPPRLNPANIFFRNEEEKKKHLWELENIDLLLPEDNDEPLKLN